MPAFALRHAALLVPLALSITTASCILPSPQQEKARQALLSKGSEPVTVKLSAEVGHPISPYIVGSNHMKPDMIRDLGCTVNRWGGNRSSKYNWKRDIDSAGSDWFYMNGHSVSEGTPEEKKGYYKFIKETRDAGADVNFTIPIGPWVAKPGGKCSFPLSQYSGQNKSDSGCGDGLLVGGKDKLWGNDPNISMTPNSVDLQRGLVENIKKSFGGAANKGVRFFSLDNEPGLWSGTHRDTVPKGISAEELVELNIKYAAMIKEVDPAAQVIGFSAWGVIELAGSNADFTPPGPDGYKRYTKFKDGEEKFAEKKKHDGQSQLVYYLRQMKAAEQKYGKRLIDVIDVHWYPEIYGRDKKGDKKRLQDNLPYDQGLADQQFDAIREWFDPTFSNPDSWTANDENKYIMWAPFHPVIAGLKKVIEENYPGTKLAINEYDTGSRDAYHGALIRAAVLGIFMQEDLYMGQNWYQGDDSHYLYFAQKLYGNYDGKGSRVGGNFVKSESSNKELLSYAAVDKGRTFVVLINRSHTARFQTTVKMTRATRSFRTYTLSEKVGLRLKESDAQATAGSDVAVNVSPYSAMLVVAE
jgi:Glycoside hydrolase family 44